MELYIVYTNSGDYPEPLIIFSRMRWDAIQFILDQGCKRMSENLYLHPDQHAMWVEEETLGTLFKKHQNKQPGTS